MDPNGDPVGSGKPGLLLYKGGKVCSEGFRDIAANYFCNELGFSSAKGWFSGHYFTLQDDLVFTISGIHCTADQNTTLNQCTWKDRDFKCLDENSVFLTCRGSIQIPEFLSGRKFLDHSLEVCKWFYFII